MFVKTKLHFQRHLGRQDCSFILLFQRRHLGKLLKPKHFFYLFLFFVGGTNHQCQTNIWTDTNGNKHRPERTYTQPGYLQWHLMLLLDSLLTRRRFRSIPIDFSVDFLRQISGNLTGLLMPGGLGIQIIVKMNQNR